MLGKGRIIVDGETRKWFLSSGSSPVSTRTDSKGAFTITQKEDQIELETKLIQPDNERVVKDTYILDGKEHEFTPQVPANQPPPVKGKRTAIWLPGDKGIQVTEVTTAESPKGAVTTQVVRKWTISGEGELVIDMYVDNPNISYEAKRIFKKM